MIRFLGCGFAIKKICHVWMCVFNFNMVTFCTIGRDKVILNINDSEINYWTYQIFLKLSVLLIECFNMSIVKAGDVKLMDGVFPTYSIRISRKNWLINVFEFWLKLWKGKFNLFFKLFLCICWGNSQYSQKFHNLLCFSLWINKGILFNWRRL